MRADFKVVLDSCVLVEAAVSDLILRLAEEPRLLIPKWTEAIWDEVVRTWKTKLSWDEAIAHSRCAAAKETFPEAMISSYEHLIPFCKNHEKDRHVLAAAIHEKADAILTFNAKHFAPVAAEWQVEIINPGEYLCVLYDLEPAVVQHALEQMAIAAGRDLPSMLARLSWNAAKFSNYAAEKLAIEVPDIAPQDWRR